MGGHPKVCVITVCSHDPLGLEQTVNSALDQSYSNIELVIIDDNSCPQTYEFLKNIRMPNVKWLSEPDSGIYDAMNKGIALSDDAEWLIFMNAGDTFTEPSVVASVFRSAEILSSTTIIFGKAICRFGNVAGLRYSHFNSEDPCFYKKRMPCHQSCFIKAHFCHENRYNTSLKYFADTIFLQKCLAQGEYIEVAEKISLFELGGRSNWYMSLQHLFNLIQESQIVTQMRIRPIFVHFLKFLMQKMLGKSLYFSAYIRLFLD